MLKEKTFAYNLVHGGVPDSHKVSWNKRLEIPEVIFELL